MNGTTPKETFNPLDQPEMGMGEEDLYEPTNPITYNAIQQFIRKHHDDEISLVCGVYMLTGGTFKLKQKETENGLSTTTDR